MLSSIAIFDQDSKKDIIQVVVEYLKSEYKIIEDIVIFSDRFTDSEQLNLGILSSIYLEFFKGHLIFLDINDYLYYKDKLLANKISVLLDMNNLPEFLDKKMLSSCDEILSISETNKVEKLTT